MIDTRLLLRAIAILGCVPLAACTLLYGNKYWLQCDSEADCLSRGTEFAGTTCNADHTCVPIPTDSSLCTSHQDCTNRAGGAASICRKSDRKCAPLLSDQCTKVFGPKEDTLNDNAIVIGWLYPNDANGAQEELALEMARAEIRSGFGGGLPSTQPGGKARPLVVVGCPVELSGTTLVTAAGAHLLNDLEAPILLGGQSVEPTIFVDTTYTIPKNRLNLTYSLSSAVSNIAKSSGLVFRVEFNDTAAISGLMTPLMTQQIEPMLKAQNIVAPGEEVRVAVIVNPTLGPQTNVNAIIDKMQFNGKSVADNGSNFLLVIGGNPLDPVSDPNPDQQLAAAVAKTIAFKPHLVIIASPPVVYPQAVLLALDAQIPPPKPLYFTTQTNWPLPVTAAIGANDDLRKRYFGLLTPPPVPNPNKAAWQVLFRTQNPGIGQAPIIPLSDYVYDSLYLASYSILAAGTDQLDGAALAKGVRRVTSTGGDPITFGGDQVVQAAGAIAAGKNLTYNGIDGPIIFNDSGDRAGLGSVYCLASNAAGVASSVHPSGFTVDPNTGANVSANFTCPTPAGQP
jgi:hypothetical protein